MFDYATAFAIFSAILLAGLLKGIIGVGFQTVGIAFLTVITNLPNAISLLLIPSLVTNLWQAGAGGELFTILIRLWPLIITASMMVWFGSIALTSVSLSYLSTLLGVLLIIYSTFSLFGLRFEVKTKNEWWLAPFIGLINGVLTGMTGIFVVPCVFYFQAIGFRKDTLIQSMGVLFTALTLILIVSLKTKKPLGSTNTTPESFVEIWSFIRRRGVKSTPSGRGLFEGNCPNCATALELNQVGACTSCKAVLRNGDYDWVLAEITQASVWRPRTLDHAAPTIASYRATHDAGFTMQHIEDRASVIFWRKVLSDRESCIDPLKKIATAAFCTAYEVAIYAVASLGRHPPPLRA